MFPVYDGLIDTERQKDREMEKEIDTRMYMCVILPPPLAVCVSNFQWLNIGPKD